MKELQFSSIKDVKQKLASKEISHKELVDNTLSLIQKYDPVLGATVDIFDTDQVIKDTASSGILQGIPGFLKANMCHKGKETHCASKILEGYKAPYDATVVSRLKNQGASIVATANMDEFAMGSSTETSAYHITRNPWDITRVPGGSSGGSASAVAAGLAYWSLGSDTGGSIRQPAGLCGIVGLKPTYGRVSRYGLIAYGSSLDTIGPFTRTVYDNALVFSALAGHDPLDGSSVDKPDNDYTQGLDGKLKDGFTLGVLENAFDNPDGYDPEVYQSLMNAIDHFKSLGARIKYIKLPALDHSAATYFIISRAEAASNLARFDGVRYGYRSQSSESLSDMYTHTRHEGFGKEVQRRILIGNYVLSAGHADEYYAQAQNVRRLIRQELMSAFKDVDMIFAPTTPNPAFKFNEFAGSKLAMDLQDYSTSPANLAGTPALAVPCGFTQQDLPIGFQLFGPDFSEHELFKAAYAYEQSTEWHKRHPDVSSWVLT
jgi:aspartyl-tRNA(Asn)/glutamyl-tRNA(Gln) amidotransferase subunit A